MSSKKRNFKLTRQSLHFCIPPQLPSHSLMESETEQLKLLQRNSKKALKTCNVAICVNHLQTESSKASPRPEEIQPCTATLLSSGECKSPLYKLLVVKMWSPKLQHPWVFSGTLSVCITTDVQVHTVTSALQSTSLMTFTLLDPQKKKKKTTTLHGQNIFGEKIKNPFFQVDKNLSPANRSLLHSPGTRGLQVNPDS